MLIPVGALAYHLGPGQAQLGLDRASQVLLEADQLAGQKKWDLAQAQYERALELVPGEQIGRIRKIRLERAKAQMENAQLPAAHADLKSLVAELGADPNCRCKIAGRSAIDVGQQSILHDLVDATRRSLAG